MTLLRRILYDHRGAVVPLVIAALANVAAYALVVHPLEVKSATAHTRAASAATALRGAEADHTDAQARVASRSRAEQELGTFYGKVLPADLAAARRLTHTTIPDLADKSNVSFEASRWEEDKAANAPGSLGHLKVRVQLRGEYENLRRFIYNLETAPPFVIIDDVTLAQAEPDKPLLLTVDLSIYYRLGANGA